MRARGPHFFSQDILHIAAGIGNVDDHFRADRVFVLFVDLIDGSAGTRRKENKAYDQIINHGAKDVGLFQKSGYAPESFKEGYVIFAERLINFNAQTDLLRK